MGHCPDWSRGSMKKAGGGSNSPRQSSDFATFNRKPDMSHYMDGGMAKKNYRDGGKVMGYADGGIVEGKSIDDYTEDELKAIGLEASKSDEKGGMFDRLTEGNIDQSGSKAYSKYGAGRGRTEVLKKLGTKYNPEGPALNPNKMSYDPEGPAQSMPKPSEPKKVQASSAKKTETKKPEAKKIPVSAPTDMDALYEEQANAERSGYEAADRAERNAERNKIIADLQGMPTKDKVDTSRVTKSSGGEMGESKTSKKAFKPTPNNTSDVTDMPIVTGLGDMVRKTADMGRKTSEAKKEQNKKVSEGLKRYEAMKAEQKARKNRKPSSFDPENM